MNTSKYNLAVALAVLLLLALGGPAMAQGCFAGVGVAVGPNVTVHPGDLVPYGVLVVNTGTCDLENVNLFFYPPTPDGNAPAFGPSSTLDCAPGASAVLVRTIASLPSGGSAGPFFDDAIGGTLARVATVNPGVCHLMPGVQACAHPLTVPPTSNFATAVATNIVTILQPDIQVTKTATPQQSKAGHVVSYEICVTNTSGCQATLTNITVNDTLLGDLSGSFADSLPSGGSECHSFPYTVQPGDPDPLINTVTATGQDALALQVTDQASASVDLVHPGCEVTKTCLPAQVPQGGQITYEICVHNTGDVAMTNIAVVDTLLGDKSADFPGPIAPGAQVCHTYTYNVPNDQPPGSLPNTVTVNWNPQGFPDNHEVCSAQCSVQVVPACLACAKTVTPGTSKAGDQVSYELCVSNPCQVPLENVTVVDSLLGDKSGDFADTLAPGASECHTYTYTVQPGDPDPLVNTMTVTANAVGAATNLLTCTSQASVDLLHPAFTLSKTCSPDPVAVGGTITWTIVVANTGDVSLDIHVVDPVAAIDQTVTVAAGGSHTLTNARVVVAGDAPAIANTATATATITGGILPNVIIPEPPTATDTCQVTVQGGPTRTPGYWFTHPTKLLDAYACLGVDRIEFLPCAGSCSASPDDAMAIFWNTAGTNRPTLAQHILAAMFNQCMFGTIAPDDIIANGMAVLCNPNATSDEISAAIGPLGAFNSSGDTLTPPGWVDVSANPATSRAMANSGTVPDCAAGKRVGRPGRTR
jgi:uncharacterized repeat protein (TIGR01451 family)